MRDNIKHLPVNWVDGMKISKQHFIAQDDAWKDAMFDSATLNLSPLRYGLLPSSSSGEETFNIKVTLDNQNTLRVAVLSCNAITPGGVRIIIPALSGLSEIDSFPGTTYSFSPSRDEGVWYIVLIVNPYKNQPVGSLELNDVPPRFPFVLPTYKAEVVSESQYKEFASHPYALTVGKIMVNGSEVLEDIEYIPPCYSINSHSDLMSFHSAIDRFLGSLETNSVAIVQNIYRKNQQNELAELVKFLCDRVIVSLSYNITSMRLFFLYEAPVVLFVTITSLARIIKNSIDTRIGTGKEAAMNYFSKWTELKPGEFENMLNSLAVLKYDNNDINKNIQSVTPFIEITSKLFKTLSSLEFIGELPEKDRIFIKEEPIKNASEQSSVRRRFFG